MSSQDSTATLIEGLNSIVIDNYCVLAVSVLLVYEYLVTFKQEVELFWTRKWSGATVLFLSNRYILLVAYVIGLFTDAHWLSDAGCAGLAKTVRAIQILEYLPWAAFSALRAYALGRNLPLGIFVFLIAVTPLGMNAALFHFNLTGVNLPIIGCTGEDDLTPAFSRKCKLPRTRSRVKTDKVLPVTIVSRTCLIGADILLIAVTWVAIVGKGKGKIRGILGNNFLSFAEVLLFDGIMYFVVLFILNSLHLIFTLLSIIISLQNASYVSIFTDPMISILVSRFLIDLQATNQRAIGGVGAGADTDAVPGASHSTSSSLVFDRVVGSLASSLEPPYTVTESEDGEGDDESRSAPEEQICEDTHMGKGSQDIEMSAITPMSFNNVAEPRVAR